MLEFVVEPLLQQQIDGVRAEVPGGRAIAARRPAAQLLDRVVAKRQPLSFLLARQAGGRHVAPAVMADLMALLDHLAADLGVGLDHHARHEPGAAQLVFLEQRRIRFAPTTPNSPREIGVGVVMPRAAQPDIASKSKVRQAIYLVMV